MIASQKKTWIYFTFGSIILAAIFPILASEILKSAPPFLTLLLTFGVAAIVLLLIIYVRGELGELQNRKAWKYGLLTGIFNGLLFYGFYYFGLMGTSPGNAVLLAQSEIIFSFLYFQKWHKENLSKNHIIGAILTVAGVLYLLFPKNGLHYGDLLICIGVMFAPIGNHYQKKGTNFVSSQVFLFIRYLCTLPFLFVVSWSQQEYNHFSYTHGFMVQIILMGVLVFVIKNFLWIESIKSVTVTRIVALHGFTPFLTLMILWGLFGTPPSWAQLLSGIPIFLGVMLLCKK